MVYKYSIEVFLKTENHGEIEIENNGGKKTWN